jgi:PrtD family type I secretion system ABC transporter
VFGSVRSIFASRRGALWTAFLFTGVINALMMATPLYSMQVFSNVVPTGSMETLVSLTCMAAMAMIVMSILELIRDRILYKAGLWLDFNLAGYVLERWLRAGTGPGQASDVRIEAKLVSTIKAYSTGPAINPLFDAPWAPLFLIGLFLLHPLLGLVGVVSALLLAIAALLQAFASDGPQSEAARAQEQADKWWQSATADSARLNGAGMGPIVRDRWEMLAEESAQRAYDLHCRSNLIKMFAKAIRLLSQIAIFAAGALVVIKAEASSGVLIASSLLMGRALAPFEQSVPLLKLFIAAAKSARLLKSLPKPASEDLIDLQSEPIAGHLTLQDVAYAYPGRTSLALRGVSLELAPGQSLGIIGPNGAGKSTLAALMAGALDPRSGSVDLDGLALSKWQRGLEQPLIGYVGTQPALFDGTVHENIVRFRDFSLMSAAQAAMKIGAHEILSELPNGYDTKVAADGTGLSVREARAIALARAVHGGTRIIVLDEPELGLDGAGEKRLMTLLAALKQAKVTLIIATQQPRLLALTERVAVLKKGNLEMFGPAAEVMAKVQGGRPGPAQATAQPPGQASAPPAQTIPSAQPATAAQSATVSARPPQALQAQPA